MRASNVPDWTVWPRPNRSYLVTAVPPVQVCIVFLFIYLKRGMSLIISNTSNVYLSIGAYIFQDA